MAPLLPKLRGHFAEFLNNASSVGLRILSSSTCVGLRYGYVINDSGFSRRMACALPYFLSVRFTPSLCCTDLPLQLVLRLHAAFHSAPALSTRVPTVLLLRSTGISTCSRLTQGRSALPWKPWIFGREDSHLSLATHSGILSSIQSTVPSSSASSRMQCSSTDVSIPQLRCRVSAPDIFGAGPLD